MPSRMSSAKLITVVLGALLVLFLPPAPAMAAERGATLKRNVELLRGTVRPVAHSARGRASVVSVNGRRRVLNLRRFRIDPGPKVLVYLVPRGARSDRRIPRDFRSLGRLRGSRGNQRYAIPASVDLRKYTSVVFWCVPFTQALARADLRRS